MTTQCPRALRGGTSGGSLYAVRSTQDAGRWSAACGSALGCARRGRFAGLRLDGHAVEGAIHEEQSDQEERRRKNVGERSGIGSIAERYRQLYRQETEERRELDDR